MNISGIGTKCVFCVVGIRIALIRDWRLNMSHQTAQVWAKRAALLHIENIIGDLSMLQRMTDNGCRIPARLRRKLESTIKKVDATQKDFKDWAITDTEKTRREN